MPTGIDLAEADYFLQRPAADLQCLQLVVVEGGGREPDQFRIAAEMLAQHHRVRGRERAELQHRALHIEHGQPFQHVGLLADVGAEVVDQIRAVLVVQRDAGVGGLDVGELLGVAQHHHLARAQQRRQRLRHRHLRAFIDHQHVEQVRCQRHVLAELADAGDHHRERLAHALELVHREFLPVGDHARQCPRVGTVMIHEADQAPIHVGIHHRGVQAFQLGLGADIVVLRRIDEGLARGHPALQEAQGQRPQRGIVLRLGQQGLDDGRIEPRQQGHCLPCNPRTRSRRGAVGDLPVAGRQLCAQAFGLQLHAQRVCALHDGLQGRCIVLEQQWPGGAQLVEL
ncbi:hypothetical protein D3C73_745400 [compost metagenome]